MTKSYKTQHVLDLDPTVVAQLMSNGDIAAVCAAFKAQDLFLSKNSRVRTLGSALQITDYYNDQMYSLRRRNEHIAVYQTVHEISDEDLEILGFLHNYRVLTAERLARLTGREAIRIRARLVRLYERSYIGRRRLAKRDRYYYWIKKKGKFELVDALKITEDEAKLRDRTGELSPRGVEHELMISDIHSGLERACRNSRFNLLEFKQGERHLAVKLPLEFPQGDRTTMKFVADGYFLVEDPEEPILEKRVVFLFLEAQRSLIDAERFQEEKVLRYKQLFEEGIFQKEFGRPRFKVLTVGVRPGMTQGMCRATYEVLLRKHGKNPVGGTNYLFSSIEPFLAADPQAILEPIYQCAADCGRGSWSLLGPRKSQAK